MTKMTYDVINRPKKNASGRTNVGWAAECGREQVLVGGYLVTKRTLPDEPKQYTAMVIMPKKDVTGQNEVVETMVGASFETRATAAFAIWRKYYEGWRDARAEQRADDEQVREQKSIDRAHRREFRQTPEGQKAYREELNQKARERRATMTPEEKADAATQRRHKRLTKKMAESY